MTLLSFFSVLAVESFHSSFSIYELLLAREKRVAGRANVKMYVLFGGTGFHLVPAGTSNCNVVILRMYVLFQLIHLHNTIKMAAFAACFSRRAL
jgi:hypothetical protein